jgi:hypothetical protein
VKAEAGAAEVADVDFVPVVAEVGGASNGIEQGVLPLDAD